MKELCPDNLSCASPFIREECWGCAAKSTCGGGCPAVPINKEITTTTLEGHYCHTSKLFLKNMISLLWDNIKNSAAAHVEKNGYYIPTSADRKMLYGKINVDPFNLDFQFTPVPDAIRQEDVV